MESSYSLIYFVPKLKYAMGEREIDKQLVEQMFRESYSRFFYFALHYIPDDEACKDIVLEAFTDLWSNREAVSTQKMKGYVFVAIRNKCLTYLKQNALQHPVDEQLAQQIASETDEEWKRKEKRIQAIEAFVETMSEGMRLVLEARYFRHMSYQEIADEYGLTVETVRKRLTRSLSQIRASFNLNERQNLSTLLLFLVII